MKCMKWCFQHQEAESKQTLDGCEMERVQEEELLFLPAVKRENGDVNRKVTGKSKAHHDTCKPAPGEEYRGEMPR